MRAIEITGPGGPDVLRLAERPLPEPGPNEVRVRVRAAGVNRPDLLQREGKYPPPPGASDIPGLELAGLIDAIGPAAPGLSLRWSPGDSVCALVSGGAYADYAIVPAPLCLPVPHTLDLIAAAAIPETYFTVWTNVFQRAGLSSGESILVHGGASGIGTTAIQLARAFGAEPYATAGTDGKCAACERLGARRAINYRAEDFVAAVLDDTGGRGVDVVLDIIGGEYLPRNLSVLAADGRLVQIGLLGGAKGTINLAKMMERRLTVTGSTLRSRSVSEKAAIARQLEEHVWPHLAAGTVRPIVAQTLPLAEAAEAHRLLEAGEVIGKLVLTID